VRGRTTIAAMVVVALAGIAAAVLLVWTLRYLLVDEEAKTVKLRVTEVARQTLTAVGTTGRPPIELEVSDPGAEFVQLLDPTGAVVAASYNVSGLPVQGPVSADPVEIIGPLAEHPLVLMSGTVDTGTSGLGTLTVLVGRSLNTVDDFATTVATVLAGGLPPLLVAIGVAAWLLTGHALAPVEAIRAEVDAISSAELGQRVPEPPGEDEIARLARTMNGMLGRLEQSVRRQRQLVADASHELRSPVAAIRQHAEVSLADPTRYPGAALAGPVLTEALRMQRLVDDLVLLARADEGSLESRREPVDLDDLMFEEATRLRSTTTLRVNTGAVSAGRVDGDPEGLRRLLRNLAENAARHAARQVSLGLAEHDGHVLLTVEDDGPGIPEDERDRVLERFVRLDEARARDHGGSGLGLAIVAELARAHDARLRIADAALGGARVELRFPCSTDAVHSTDPA
jgi:signal transduction histidine kinase